MLRPGGPSGSGGPSDEGRSASAKYKHIMKVAAADEARALGHNHVRTGHVLLAVLNDPETVASRVLSQLNVEIDAVRREVTGALPPPDEVRTEDIGLNLECRTMLQESMGWAAMGPDMKLIAELAKTDPEAVRKEFELMRNRSKPRMDTHLLLVGMLGLEESIAGQVLLRQGLSPEQIMQEAAGLPPED